MRKEGIDSERREHGFKCCISVCKRLEEFWEIVQWKTKFLFDKSKKTAFKMFITTPFYVSKYKQIEEINFLCFIGEVLVNVFFFKCKTIIYNTWWIRDTTMTNTAKDVSAQKVQHSFLLPDCCCCSLDEMFPGEQSLLNDEGRLVELCLEFGDMIADGTEC